MVILACFNLVICYKKILTLHNLEIDLYFCLLSRESIDMSHYIKKTFRLVPFVTQISATDANFNAHMILT